jgi:hypothetical protein
MFYVVTRRSSIMCGHVPTVNVRALRVVTQFVYHNPFVAQALLPRS